MYILTTWLFQPIRQKHISTLSFLSAITVFLILVAPLILPASAYAQSSSVKKVDIPAGLQQAYQQARHKFEVVEKKGQPKVWRARNSGNHMTVNFDGKGFIAQATRNDWHLKMELTGIGAPGQLKPVKPAVVQIKDNRLTYDRGNLKEWYINDPKGMEQGFTLDKPLTDVKSKDQLVLQFALGGNVKTALMPDKRALQLTTPAGKRLRYEGLKAWDANGKDLKAQMGLKGQALQLTVAVAGAAYPITIDPVLVEDQKLTASDAAAYDYFGYSVAVSGDTALVGAYQDDDGGTNSGSAYVFIKNGTTWTQQQKLTASDAALGDQFGISVALSGDTALVGAHLDDDAGGSSGSAYVFVRSGTTWSEQQKLTASDAAASDQFGNAVAVSGDTALVGAYLDDDVATSSGSAYVFVRSGTTWTEQAKLVASDPAFGDYFGFSVALSGNTALVGAYLDDDGGTNTGSAYVFVRSGMSWSQQAKLVADDAAGGDQFGSSVAASGDTAVVGANFDDDAGFSSGSAYVFVRSVTTWTQQTKLVAGDDAAGDQFGISVAVSGDTAVVGAFGDDDAGATSGSAYVFVRSGMSWSQQAKPIAGDAAASDRFGFSVAVSGDTAVVGAYWDDDAATDSGSAYTFDLSCATTYSLPANSWRQISLPCNPGVNNTPAALFGDDGLGVYGTDWILWAYDPALNDYVDPGLSGALEQGVGYWIIQLGTGAVTLDMPVNSTPTLATLSATCTTTKGCFETSPATESGAVVWNMTGFPFDASNALADARVTTDSGVCSMAGGCDLDAAQAQDIVNNQLWTYNGAGYTAVDTSGNLDPWTGYWLPTLTSANGTNPKLLQPKP